MQESHTEARGLWSLPLGFVEKGESLKEAAMREAKEETGYECVLLDASMNLILEGPDFKSNGEHFYKQIELTIYKADITGGKFLKGEDVMDAAWVGLKDLQNLPLRGLWVRKILDNLL